jgi:adenylate cyclase
MKTFLSRHRFEVLALALGLLFCALHVWVDRSPSVGLQEGGGSGENVLLRGLHFFEGRATDVQFRLRGHRAPHPDVVVVAVDEKSVQALGRWPWPRQVLARALDRLRDAGVAAVGLDMTFTDEVPDERAQAYAEAVAKLDQVLAETPEPSPALLTLREDLKGRSNSSGDEALAAALARAPQVVQGVIAYSRNERAQFASQALEREPALSGHLIRRFPGSVPGSFHEVNPEKLVAWRSHSIQIPLPAFVQASKRLGHFNVAPDFDGTVRRVPLFILLEGPAGLIPQLELQTAAAYLHSEVEPAYDPEMRRITGARLRRPDGTLLPLEVPVPFDDPLVPVNYPGPGKVFPTVSLADVVEGKADPAALQGKAALLGVTLVGNFDQRVTPFSEFEPGLYIHAAFLSNILSQDFLTRPLYARPLELLFMLGASLLLARLLPRVRFAWKLGATALLLASWLTVDQLLFARGIQVATVLPLGSVIFSAFGVIFLGYFSVDAEKARLRDTFQHYLDASVMEQVLANPEKLKLGGERKELSVLFSDIRGFTTLSERMTPEQLVAFINQYLTPMTDIVFTNGGTLDKYIGDAIMAFWGAPVDQPDHALRACRAALGFVEKLDELRAGWRAAGLPEVDIGVGINSGFMNVGHMGTASRFNYTVMGDAVNLASRLEGLNKTYDTRILISAETYTHVQGRVTSRRLGVVRVKGKQSVTDIYELRAMGPPSGQDAEAIESFEAGVQCFIDREFVNAEGYFRRVLMLWPEDKPSRRYLDELNVLRWNRPGPEWDGVFTATTK